MLGTVSHAVPRSHAVLSVCGPGQARHGHHGQVHVLTALLTRRAPSELGSLELLRLATLMSPSRTAAARVDERLLNWGQC